MERLSRAKRHFAIWTAIAAVVVLAPGMALAGKSNPQRGWEGGSGERHGESGPGLTVDGRAASQADNETWALGIRGGFRSTETQGG